jgi:hypothetical protein
MTLHDNGSSLSLSLSLGVVENDHQTGLANFYAEHTIPASKQRRLVYVIRRLETEKYTPHFSLREIRINTEQ